MRKVNKVLRLIKKLNKLCGFRARLEENHEIPAELTISLTFSEDEGYQYNFFSKLLDILT